MVMCIEPIHRLVDRLKSERHYEEVIFLTLTGKSSAKNSQPACHHE
jgi:tRNA G37 N-methylase TrmD